MVRFSFRAEGRVAGCESERVLRVRCGWGQQGSLEARGSRCRRSSRECSSAGCEASAELMDGGTGVRWQDCTRCAASAQVTSAANASGRGALQRPSCTPLPALVSRHPPSHNPAFCAQGFGLGSARVWPLHHAPWAWSPCVTCDAPRGRVAAAAALAAAGPGPGRGSGRWG